jgi:hypothetical protein
MPLISRLIGSVAFLSMAVCSADAALRGQPGALDWQTFKVPEYGTRADYPARILAAVGGAEKGVGQRFESDDGRATLSIYARENEEGDTPASYLRKNLRQSGLDYERITRSFFAIPWNGRGRSTTADAIFRVLPAAPYIVST